MTIDLGFIGSLVLLVLLFLGLILACKVTNFNASVAELATVTVITFGLGLIPSIGGFVAIIAQYLMLKKINPQGTVIFTMFVSLITTFFVFFLFSMVLNKVSFSF